MSCRNRIDRWLCAGRRDRAQGPMSVSTTRCARLRMELHAAPTTPGNASEMNGRGQHATACGTMPLPALGQWSDRPTAADPSWDPLKRFPLSLSTPLPHAMCLSRSHMSISSLLLCSVRIHLPLPYASAGTFGTGTGGGSRRDGDVQSSGFSPSFAAISSWALYLYLKLSPALRSGISLVNIVLECRNAR